MQLQTNNPAVTAPGAPQALQRLSAAVRRTGVPATTLSLMEARARQIHGCNVCLDMHSRELKAAGETDERGFMVGAWRKAPYFSGAERAALALTEAAVRLADRSDPIPDEVWEGAARHYDETQLAGLVATIATINAYNRINTKTRQITGGWVDQSLSRPAPAGEAA